MKADSPPRQNYEDALLGIVREMSSAMRPPAESEVTVALDSTLEGDLGFDSLTRAELLTRLEHRFGVSLPEQVLAQADTPRALLRALLAAQDLPPGASGTHLRQARPAPAAQAPDSAATLPDVLRWHLRSHPERTHIILQDGDGADTQISFAQLHRGAAAIAAGLVSRGVSAGTAVAIMLPTSPEYFYSFCGVLLAGGIPVPLYPPARLAQIGDHLQRHAGILANAQAPVLITVAQARPLAALLKASTGTLHSVLTPQELADGGGAPVHPMLRTHDIALLQYTSGSTGSPKGVVLSHANLLANLRAMGKTLAVGSQDVFVSWLPLYHDMGLIGAWLGSLYYAYPLVVMSPLAFLARPERWLWAIHKYRGTLSGGPNFAFELCLRKLANADLAGLDLSSWRFVFNGAEPVSLQTMRVFMERFARYGLRPQAAAPVYGLAEASLGLAFPPLGRGLAADRIDRDKFTRTAVAVPAGEHGPTGERETLEFPSCGRPLSGHEVRIVDATGRELGERHEGLLQFRGPSATSGYFRNPVQTRQLFDRGWLNTGDYAYIAADEVYITGRAKETIVRGGRNIYPYELEQAVGAIPGIRKGCVAVFGSPDPDSGTERIVVMAETAEKDVQARRALHRQALKTALDVLGMPPDHIALVPPHSILKTSSGKIRRAACRERFEHGRPGRGVEAPWLQIARFGWRALRPELRRGRQTAASLSYALYTWLLFATLAPATWLASVALHRPALGWTLSHHAARLFLRLGAVPWFVQGLEHLPRNRPCILVSNHASYLDGIVLVAALPTPVCMVAKRELQRQRIPGTYLASIGADFIDRFDNVREHEDVERVVAAVRAGHSALFFPEGTFGRAPGLQAFRSGAFLAAARAGAPVVPVAIRGTRSVLRDGQWLPRRGPIGVVIGSPLWPDGADWPAAMRLRNTARAEILHYCGEPDARRTTHRDARRA
ncbi:O-succinylbenzoic acid-CoA ligase MenE or related acyl-CoA synthetase (AMP-forming) [Cupriavidus necator]|uniref:Acyl-phosphate glycerol 3-phosphate acyltransferase n=3 Tax=Cupriavidus necator TaxID=106590 RepID=Q0JZE2_CUPNH|nr:AMP-binding protein [Cupriavidus necator]QCC04680.1 acyl-phosphate glycerol 3-phosphate acyltransferase [Cupriavidus necator H16]QQB79373.1 AMP-binding protein [Cupriavidus necator]WKA43602.1 AMP-binding protein [Cupriavidus necator]CAJ96882.1 two domain protein: Acyl-CoA synthetase (AMP-forming) and acytransferase [Cupriavidus necator H16]